MLRLLALSTALVSLVSSVPLFAGEEVDWLPDVRAEPTNAPVPWRPLTPLVPASDKDPKAAWNQRRADLRSAWLAFLGEMPRPPGDLASQSLRRESLEWGTRELVEYEGEPGLRVQAYILKPKNAAARALPGIVALHPTTNLSIDAIAGVQGEPRQHTAVKLSQSGFVVVCPRCFLWQDAPDLNAAVARHRERHPQTTGMAKMLYDAMRGVDLLLAQPEVDPKRVGAFGHSLGAKEVLYLLAFDDRVRAGVASEGGVALDSTNWDAPWYLGPRAKDPAWERNHHELLGLIAPRPFLVIGGEQGPGAADGGRSIPYLIAAEPVYELSGGPVRLGLLNHGKGHPLTPEAFEKGVEWLKAYTAK